jgi:protein SCO1/2
MSRTTMIALALAGVLAGAGLAMLALRAPSSITEAVTRVTGKAAVGGPFNLVDQTGKRVTDKDFRGRYMLVFFGYTNCPDICPSGLQVMSAALDKLGRRGADIVPILITLDPQHDTPQKLASYIKSFSPRLIALTGTDGDIAATAKAYRVFFQKVPDEQDPSHYSIDHSGLFYLMGKDGALLAPIPHTTDVDQFVQGIDKALS